MTDTKLQARADAYSTLADCAIRKARKRLAVVDVEGAMAILKKFLDDDQIYQQAVDAEIAATAARKALEDS